jgi:hypothetical protein
MDRHPCPSEAFHPTISRAAVASAVPCGPAEADNIY